MFSKVNTADCFFVYTCYLVKLYNFSFKYKCWKIEKLTSDFSIRLTFFSIK